jgi:hypothetical protein
MSGFFSIDTLVQLVKYGATSGIEYILGLLSMWVLLEKREWRWRWAFTLTSVWIGTLFFVVRKVWVFV